jgi:hypothetical protein
MVDFVTKSRQKHPEALPLLMEIVICNGLNDIQYKIYSGDSGRKTDRLSVTKKEHVEAEC